MKSYAIKLLPAFAIAAALLPSVASAVTFIETLALFNQVLNLLVPILIALALVVFFFGLIKYLTSLGKAESRNEAMQLMIWGVIAIFVMVSIWGIIRLLQSTFKVNNQDPIIPNAIKFGDLN